MHTETRDPSSVEEVKERLSHAPGVILIDEDNTYPTAISHAVNTDAVFVGRIRQDISHSNGLNLWIVADNIRKGAALNAVQIAEMLINENFYVDGMFH